MSEPILVDIKGAQKLLSMSENTLRWLIRTRRIPFRRIGERRIFFDPEELREWSERNRVPEVK